MTYITETEAVVLSAARKVLDDIAKRTNLTYADGRIKEACERAGDAIFNVLNIAKNFGNDPVAEKYLHEKRFAMAQAPLPKLQPITEMPVKINKDAWR